VADFWGRKLFSRVFLNASLRTPLLLLLLLLSKCSKICVHRNAGERRARKAREEAKEAKGEGEKEIPLCPLTPTVVGPQPVCGAKDKPPGQENDDNYKQQQQTRHDKQLDTIAGGQL